MEPLHINMLRIKAMSREWIKEQDFQNQYPLVEVEDKIEVIYDEIKKRLCSYETQEDYSESRRG
jgi:hypothetical protein